jgi:hypothetical protein
MSIRVVPWGRLHHRNIKIKISQLSGFIVLKKLDQIRSMRLKIYNRKFINIKVERVDPIALIKLSTEIVKNYFGIANSRA